MALFMHLGSLPFLGLCVMAILLHIIPLDHSPLEQVVVLAVGVAWVTSLGAFAGSGLIVATSHVEVSEHGMYGGLFFARLLRWSDIKKVERMWPFPLYVLRGGIIAGFSEFFGPSVMKTPKRFFELLEAYAPAGHPMRTRFLGE